jgi:Domain of unknown function (DUF4340)
MSWRRVLVYWGFAVILGALYLHGQPGGVARQTADTIPQAVQTSFKIDRDAVRSLELKRSELSIEIEKADGRTWRVTRPAGHVIPTGLIDAFVDQLADASSGEQIDDQGSDASVYGFDAPSLVVRIGVQAAAPIELVVGDRTPTRTASYARVVGLQGVFVVGLNLTYYADLLFEAVH